MKYFSPALYFYVPAAQDAIQTSLSPLIFFVCYAYHPLSSCGMNIGSSQELLLINILLVP